MVTTEKTSTSLAKMPAEGLIRDRLPERLESMQVIGLCLPGGVQQALGLSRRVVEGLDDLFVLAHKGGRNLRPGHGLVSATSAWLEVCAKA